VQVKLSSKHLRRLLIGAAMLGVAHASGGGAAAQALGTITIAGHIDLDTLDGSQNVTTHHRYVFRHIYEPLITLDAEGRIQPALAERWENIDEQTWRFHLRRDVKFQNGEPFNAEAVRFTLEQIHKPTSQARSTLSLFTKANVIDEYTVDLVTRAPYANALLQVADFIYPVPPKYYQEVGPEEFTRKPVGTGPYQVTQWRRGDRIILEASQNWWRGKPKAEKVVFWAVPEASTRVAAVLNGEADIGSQIPAIQVPRFKGSTIARIEASNSGVQPIWGGMMVDRAPFTDRRVREAVNLAINKQAIVDRLLQGYGKVMGQPCASSTICYDPNLKPYPYDPERAKALLKEAGVQSLSVTLDAPIGIVPQAAEVTQIIAADLAKVGITVKPRVEEWPVFSARLFDMKTKQSGMSDMFLMYYKGGPTAENVIQNITTSTSDWDWTHYVSPKVDELWKKAQGDFNEESRKESLLQISAQVREDAPWFFLYEPLSIWAVGKKIEWKPRNDDFVFVEDMAARAK
jgi:peptide/nickel transport system substrate-binding protein